MTTSLELSSSAIRICQMRDSTIVRVQSFPIPEDSNALDALAHAPLPSGLGPVRVLIQHEDMLQQSLVQPPAPQDRLDRIIRFELMALIPDMSTVLCNWQIAPVGGDGDLRILVNLAKRNLVERIAAALKPHGGTLAALSLPACGLYQCWKATTASTNDGDEVLVDISDQHSHVTLVRNGELLFTRTHKAGMGEIIDGIASLRNISHEDARKLADRLNRQAPEDIQQLIRNSASGLASGITSVLRFASAQLKIAPISPQRLCLAGAGGQLPGLRQTLQDRLKCPTVLINPFADLTLGLDDESADQLAELPSPWATVIGGARSSTIPLDAMQQVRQERVAYWSTHGILRAAALTAVALMVLALSRQFIAAHNAESRQDTLANRSDGLVTVAEQQMRELQEFSNTINTERQRTRFLHDQLAPGKVAHEILNAMASLIDPMTQRIQLNDYRLYRSDNQLRMIITGTAEESSGRRFGAVLDSYRQQLLSAYPLIVGISDLGSSIDDDNRMRFQWELRIAHLATVPDEEASEDSEGTGSSEPAAPAASRPPRGQRNTR